jgi:hypothetical protein
MKHRIALLKNLLATVLLVLGFVGAAQSASGQRQVCNGVLARDENGLFLERDPESKSLWCDAYLEKNSSLESRVLKTCSVGDRCHIDGKFEGQGVFYWNQIRSVSQSK